MDYKELCPIGLNVRVIVPIGSDHEGWTVMPSVRDRSQMFIPEGYIVLDGVGEVTGYELTGMVKERIPESHQLKYDNLIILNQAIQCDFNEEWWLKEKSYE